MTFFQSMLAERSLPEGSPTPARALAYSICEYSGIHNKELLAAPEVNSFIDKLVKEKGGWYFATSSRTPWHLINATLRDGVVAPEDMKESFEAALFHCKCIQNAVTSEAHIANAIVLIVFTVDGYYLLVAGSRPKKSTSSLVGKVTNVLIAKMKEEMEPTEFKKLSLLMLPHKPKDAVVFIDDVMLEERLLQATQSLTKTWLAHLCAVVTFSVEKDFTINLEVPFWLVGWPLALKALEQYKAAVLSECGFPVQWTLNSRIEIYCNQCPRFVDSISLATAVKDAKAGLVQAAVVFGNHLPTCAIIRLAKEATEIEYLVDLPADQSMTDQNITRRASQLLGSIAKGGRLTVRQQHKSFTVTTIDLPRRRVML